MNSTQNSNFQLENGLRLNMQMLVDYLEDDYNIIYFNHRNDIQKLVGASIYFGQEKLDSSIVYVAEDIVFDHYPIRNPEISRIVISSPEKHIPESAHSIIQIEKTAPWELIFNRVQEIFCRFFSWDQKLSYILNNGGGIHELCKTAVDFFRNPLFVHDENFNISAIPTWVVGMTSMMSDEVSGNLTLSLDRIQHLNIDSQYITTLSTKGAHLWCPKGNPHRTIYVNLWGSEQQYHGRLVINEISACFKPSDFIMAEFFAKILVLMLERNLFEVNTEDSFESILSQMYDGQVINNSYLIGRLQMVGWEQNHEYICFKIEISKDDSYILLAKKISNIIRFALPNSFSFPNDNSVYVVCNLTVSGYREAVCRDKLEAFFSKIQLYIGASNPFTDFTLLVNYYRQAEKAVEIGKKRGIEGQYISFSTCALDYILTHFTEEFTIRSVCSQAIADLEQIDASKNTDYLNTLRVYLECGCQQTIAARKLFIHRTTLLYRLEKIQDMVSVDLDDSDTRLFLQISIRLLDFNR